MTLIVSCITRDCAFQVADRRLILSTGGVFDDDSNKMTLFDGRIAFSYTGLASLEGKRTDLWLTNLLRRPECSSADKALHILKSAAAYAAGKIALPKELKRIAFVGIGWSIPAGQKRTVPLICRVSNFHSQDGTVLSSGSDEFRHDICFPRRNLPYALITTGHALPDTVALKCHWLLRHHVKIRSAHAQLLKILVRAVRETAEENEAGGKDLLSVIVLRIAVSHSTPYILTNDGSPSEDLVSFRTWSNRNDYNAVYRPNFAGPRPVASNFTAGTLGSGSIAFGDGTFTISYPCFYFTNEARTVLLTSHPGGMKCLSVYTERENTDAMQVVAGVKTVRFQIESPEDFAALLQSVRQDFEGVCFNPTISGKCRSVPIDAMFQALAAHN